MVAAGGRLDGRVALVTGAASGIGRAVAMACAAEGAAVTALDLDRAGLQDLRRELGAGGWGGTARSSAGAARRDTVRPGSAGLTWPGSGAPGSGPAGIVVADVTSADQVAAAVTGLLDASGRIDVLVNAAGISTMAPVVSLREDEWDATMAVNAKGVFLATRAVLPSMIGRRSGAIVNIASAAGKRGSATFAHYSASKFAVIGFTQSTALEVAGHGVRVNSVCPGLITTPMQDREVSWEAALRGTTEQAVRDRYLAAVPLGRLGTPLDVAAAVVFLASDEAAYITGAAIDVGGGYAIG